MKLLVGLGNPGPTYSKNRHNIGFMVIDEVVRTYSFSSPQTKFSSQYFEGVIGGQKIMALKPQTFMNNSGTAVAEAARFYKIPLDEIVVIYDELDLEPGRVRMKKGGGAGGHNGIRSIDQYLGADYYRMRVGIGHPGHKDRVTGHVLGDFKKEDEGWLNECLWGISESLEALVLKGPEAFMNLYYTKITKP